MAATVSAGLAFFQRTAPPRHGQRLYVVDEPAPGLSLLGAVLLLPPFAEELNKTRRMVALQAREFAARGWLVLRLDLLGCGDSSGDFSDATWADWVTDLCEAATWLRARAGAAPLWLWAVRGGALFVRAVADQIGEQPNLLLWQPQVSGRQALQQFLRLRAAGELLDGGGKDVVRRLRDELAADRPVEVGGYRLGPALAAGLDQAALTPPPGPVSHHVEWLEAQLQAGAAPSLAATKAVKSWQQSGARARLHQFSGPMFWQTTEIEDAPALIQASCAALAEAVAPSPAAPVHTPRAAAGQAL